MGNNTVSNDNLTINPVSVGESYECLLEQELNITSEMKLSLDQTKWQAFEVPAKGFNNSK